MYIEQVNRFLDYFEKDKMYFCAAERLNKYPKNVLREIFRFLNIDDGPCENIDTDIKRNETVLPLSKYLRYLTRSFFKKKSIPSRIERKLNRHLTKGYPDMKNETKKHLKGRFEQPNKKLQDRIEIDVTNWT
jgi:hypothetical protein